jgi:List-Bact-rpt repeat protein
LAGFVLILLLASGLPPSQSTRSPFAGPAADHPLSSTTSGNVPLPGTPFEASLAVNNSSVNLSSDFWGSTVNNEVRMFRGESNAVNATPARVLVWPGAMAGEDYDPLTDTHYDTNTGTPVHALTSEAQFVRMCKATHCTAIVQVPAEIDNPSIAEAIVNYTEVNLSFTPAYWMIGNEPELWGHWQVPWQEWPTTFTAGPDPTQFGQEVVAYVHVIRAVDSSTPILGLPASGCTCGSYTFEQWISGVLSVTGPIIQAVAFHEYPAGWLGTGDGSLHDFYATIQSAAGIPARIVGARQAVQAACPKCNVSVFVSELGSALSWSTYGQYAVGFSGALSLASQITQAMDYNLTNVDLFATELATLNSWFDTTGHARADYTLYTGILDHLGSRSFSVSVPGLDNTLYAIDTVAPNDHGRRDLLVVNDNITHAITFTPKFAGGSSVGPVEAWRWNGSIHNTVFNGTTWVEPYTPNPIPQEFSAGLPANYTIPPQSLVLFEAYPTGGTYVRVLESGVPASVAWYASVGSTFYTTTAGNLSLLLPAGSYPVASAGIPLPIGGNESVPSEQLGPVVSSPLEVSGRYTNLTIGFLPQWRVNLTSSPATGGTIGPAVGWWNANASLNLTATPTPGFAFVGWSGWGAGSANGTRRTITVTPTGRILEKARFVVGQPVQFVETGLPAGIPWSVTVREFLTNSTGSTLTVYEPKGSFGYALSEVPGYRSIPRNGGFTVGTGPNVVHVRYDLITPAPAVFPVVFLFTGIPNATPVSITVRNSTQSLGVTNPEFELSNGSYAYRVGYVPGYHPEVPLKTFQVRGGPLIVEVPFVPTLYRVTWLANGTREGMNWSVEVNGLSVAATSAWVSTTLPNGSYSYAVTLPANFSASPRLGTFELGGAAATLPLYFNLLEFPAWFEATGPGASSDWSVRFGNLTETATPNGSTFLAANGTYTFDVHPPTGYFATPSHGSVTIAGPGAPMMIRFDLTSDRPSAALVAALMSGALGTSIWIGASIFVGFAGFRTLRRRGG